MALIKCSECGKEISDKAKFCVNCGLPLKNDENEPSIKKSKNDNLEEQNIISIVLNVNNLKKGAKFFLVIGIIFSLIGLLTLPFGILFLCLGIVEICASITDNKYYIKTNLTLTNKRLKGEIYSLFNVKTINIPLERIDNIIVDTNIKKIKRITISSNTFNGSIRNVLNADDFSNAVVKQIEKYKN